VEFTSVASFKFCVYTGSEALIKRRQQKVCELVAFFRSGGEVECPDRRGREEESKRRAWIVVRIAFCRREKLFGGLFKLICVSELDPK
jgi:hypothetical protein